MPTENENTTTTDDLDQAPTDGVDEEQDKNEEGAEQLRDAGKAALDRERRARRAADKAIKELQAKLDAIVDKDKDEATRNQEAAAKATAQAQQATERAAAAERKLAVFALAGDLADPARLMRDLEFVESLRDIEPDDEEGIKDAIKAAVKSAPWLAKSQSNGGSGGDATAGQGQKPDPTKGLTGRSLLAAGLRNNTRKR